ncbi:hypothetical protein CWE17_03855 [Synechococcus sp. BS56D]|nr:hypothetical protein CWE17_03855 [Synechococcus sp. BS56D]
MRLADVCCHTCLHCTAGASAAADGGWCRLRRLPVHADLARVAWCHHWTARPPSLPRLVAMEQAVVRSDVQLELHERSLPLATRGEG